MGVMPYALLTRTSKSPMLEKIRRSSGYQSTGYMQGFLTAMLMTEAAKRTLDAKKELTAANMKASLNSIKDFDTGGLIGVPISIPGNTVRSGASINTMARRPFRSPTGSRSRSNSHGRGSTFVREQYRGRL